MDTLLMNNISINAGFAAQRLKEKLIGLNILAIVGYTTIPDDDEGTGRVVAHWRSGTVKEFWPDVMAPEIALQFHWADDEGEAEVGIFEDEDIILIIPGQSKQLLSHLE